MVTWYGTTTFRLRHQVTEYETTAYKLRSMVTRYDSSALVACENICFSSLFAAGDVSRGGTSATQRQKFHTDDAKSFLNPVRSADWSKG